MFNEDKNSLLMIMRTIHIVDSTLRDGETGIVFSKKEKQDIAVYLDQVGVYEIEAGTPAMGGMNVKPWPKLLL